MVPHSSIMFRGQVQRIRTVTPQYTEYITLSHGDGRPFFLRVPNDQALVTTLPHDTAPHQLLSLLYPWRQVDHNGDSQHQCMVQAPEDHSSFVARAVLQNATLSIDGTSPLWILRRVSVPLMVGALVNLVDADWPEHPYGPAYVMGIHALEQEWVEMAFRVCSTDVVAFGGVCIMVAVPICDVLLDLELIEAYRRLYNDLPSTLRDAHESRNRIVSVWRSSRGVYFPMPITRSVPVVTPDNA